MMTTLKDCKARQYSDQMLCCKCGLQWDVNDPEPPKCVKVVIKKPNTVIKRFKELREKLNL